MALLLYVCVPVLCPLMDESSEVMGYCSLPLGCLSST